MPKTDRYLLGLIGHPVSHSLSKRLHEAALAHCGLTGDYQLIDIEPSDLASRFSAIKESGVLGLNVTIPHKQNVLPLLDSFDSNVAKLGAVNTILFSPDRKTNGFNTDVFGFAKALEAGFRDQAFEATSESALIAGVGGAARACVAGLTEIGFNDIAVYGRDNDKARSFVSELSEKFFPARLHVLTELDVSNLADIAVFINSTPLGQDGNDLPKWFAAAIECLPKSAFVYDLVYARSPEPTAVVDKASSLQLKTVDGLQMLIYQAARAFEIWTGEWVDPKVMEASLAGVLSRPA